MSKGNIVKSGSGMDSNQILTGKGIPFAQCERKRHEHEKLQIIYSCEWRKRALNIHYVSCQRGIS